MTALEVIGYAGYVVGGVIILASKTKSDNLKDLKERVEILEKERQEAREQHVENQKAIANLEGQLSTYKEIPLKSIASSLEALPKIVDSNSQILETLKGSAVIAAKDRGVLLNTDQHINEQIVDKQTIKSKG